MVFMGMYKKIEHDVENVLQSRTGPCVCTTVVYCTYMKLHAKVVQMTDNSCIMTALYRIMACFRPHGYPHNFRIVSALFCGDRWSLFLAYRLLVQKMDIVCAVSSQ